ncbi:MAG: sigma-70 family RNA polymerase sigma factor [Actinobacteria bacterium]|nr:sigma-70 family RNA polymerase sigma factor [Actinomycetota bacterium]
MTERTGREQRAPSPADVATDDATRNAAFRRYVEPELEVLLRVARRLTGDTSDAEDIVQDTLVRAYRALHRFDGRHPRAWLLTILRNTWKNSLRKRRPVLVDDADPDLARTPARGADGRGGAEEHFMLGIVDAAITSALRSLSSKKRDVVMLVDVDGLSYQQAADVLDIPVGTVMSRLHRARTELRTQLQDNGFVRAGGA